MTRRSNGHHEHTHGPQGRQRGPSSFHMHDPDNVFQELDLKEGDSFADLGCGPGDYSIGASRIVGESGTVYAVDKWKYLIDGLKAEAKSQGVANIEAMVADITEPLPMADDAVDACLLATVIHTLHSAKEARAIFNEIHRILRPSGRLGIIECKKEDQPFGPPVEMRLSHVQVENMVIPCGFKKIRLVDLSFNYLILFCIESSDGNAPPNRSL